MSKDITVLNKAQTSFQRKSSNKVTVGKLNYHNQYDADYYIGDEAQPNSANSFLSVITNIINSLNSTNGGEIVFLEGTYVVSSATSVPLINFNNTSNITIRGSGKVIIQYNSGRDNAHVISINSNSNNINVENITIDFSSVSTGNNASLSAISVNNSTNIMFKDITILETTGTSIINIAGDTWKNITLKRVNIFISTLFDGVATRIGSSFISASCTDTSSTSSADIGNLTILECNWISSLTNGVHIGNLYVRNLIFTNCVIETLSTDRIFTPLAIQSRSNSKSIFCNNSLTSLGGVLDIGTSSSNLRIGTVTVMGNIFKQADEAQIYIQNGKTCFVGNTIICNSNGNPLNITSSGPPIVENNLLIKSIEE